MLCTTTPQLGKRGLCGRFKTRMMTTPKRTSQRAQSSLMAIGTQWVKARKVSCAFRTPQLPLQKELFVPKPWSRVYPTPRRTRQRPTLSLQQKLQQSWLIKLRRMQQLLLCYQQLSTLALTTQHMQQLQLKSLLALHQALIQWAIRTWVTSQVQPPWHLSQVRILYL